MRFLVLICSTLLVFLATSSFSVCVAAENKDNIAVLRFSGPQIVDVDADEIWKLKNKTDPPTKGELTKLTIDLQKGLIQQLRELVGKKVLSREQLDKALSGSAPEAGADKTEKLASELGAKYIVSGTIDRVEFDGNTVMKDVYVLIITTKLVDGKSGKRVWQEVSKKYTTKSYTRKTGGTVYDVFAKKQIPDVASCLAGSIAAEVGR